MWTVVCWFCAALKTVVREFHYPWGCGCFTMDKPNQEKGSQYFIPTFWLLHYVKAAESHSESGIWQAVYWNALEYSACRADTVEQNIHKWMQLFPGVPCSFCRSPNSLEIHPRTNYLSQFLVVPCTNMRHAQNDSLMFEKIFAFICLKDKCWVLWSEMSNGRLKNWSE